MLVWSSYGAVPPAVSVPAYLEQHGARLREKYLAFVHDLGQAVIGGRRVVDHFRQPDGFSFWWMNRVAEKSPFKSSRIFDCLRLLALEEMLVERRATAVTLESADSDLAEAIGRLCAGIGATFEWNRQREDAPPTRVGTARRAYDALPHWVQGLLSFRHIAMRWNFTSLRPVAWASGPNSLLLCSYLFNLDSDAAARGEFHSRQWEALPAWLRDRRVRTNWLHQFLPDGGRDVTSSADLLRTFNKDGDRQGRHAVLETYLSLSTVASIVANWFRHCVISWRLRGVGDVFTPTGSKAWLWPLLRDDWRMSMSGTAAVTNCTCRVLFDAAAKDLPRQSRGLFLFEGQGWEAAFVHAWRTHGHGEIIGVPHSSMPFWYLNIYDDARHYAPANEKPLPDRWAVNGHHARAGLAAAGMPAERMAPVEALRFQHLARMSPGAGRDVATATPAGQPLRLLLLGDFTRGQTLSMVRCLEAALPLMRHRVSVAIKRHPVCPIDATDTVAMRCEFIEQPLGEVLSRFDLAFSSNTTSAGLDALLTGLPVVVFLDDAGFNQSPLRSVPHVRFVSAPAELAAAVDALAGERVETPVDDFFWVDESLPKWTALLADAGHAHG